MAKGQHLSNYQRGIVRRYYLNRGSILLARLQELVSDLALAEGKRADTLWKRAAETLGKVETDPPLPTSRVEKILNERDIAGLASLVGELHSRS